MSNNDSNTSAPANTGIITEVTATASDPRSMRVEFDPETGVSKAEYLYTDGNSVANTADVDFPTAHHFTQELANHNQAIADLQARLDAKVHDRAGRVTGFEVADDRARAVLQLQIDQRRQSLAYTGALLAQAHAATEAKLQARAAAAERGEAPVNGANDLQAQARREALISEAADMPGPDGRPLGRLAAQKAVDAELTRERIAALVRSRR